MARHLACVALVFLAGTATAAEPVDYLADVKPVLAKRCYACHGALRQRSGLRLDTAAALLSGGDSGPVVVAGKSGESLLVEYITGDDGFRMPPDGAPLDSSEIETIRAWIDSGAIGPAEEKPQADPRDHWAFRPPVRPEVPPTRVTGESKNPIDAFLAAAHDARGLVPVGPAAKSVLLRRVYLDLVGLPPTRDELHAFLADDAPDAYERVVDRLLASPQYGERWGRHWMDVWRYSDWYGRRSVPDVMNSYPQIWRWRDWIVASLNDDKPYDQMIVEMLAADEVAPLDDHALPATGFIVRNWFKWNYNQWMRDMVEHTGKAFLGLTLNCCHCHDHKYDPITQEEYFRFRAFFEPLELRQDRLPGLADPGPFRKYVYTESYGPIAAGMIRVFDEKLDAETFMYAKGDERNRIEGQPPVDPGVPAALGGHDLVIEPVALPAEAYYPGLKPFIREEELAASRAAVQAAEAALADAKTSAVAVESNGSEPEQPLPNANSAEPTDAARVPSAAELAQLAVRTQESTLAGKRAELTALEARIAADDARYRESSHNLDVLVLAAAQAERVAALEGARLTLSASEEKLALAKCKAAGDEKAAAEVAVAAEQCATAGKAVETAEQALAEAANEYTSLGPVYPAHSTGRRTALARWIASSDNPLTARVAVNHIWMHHFGRPLVETVFDFGRNGRPPTHPELLDYLAVELMNGRWRMKSLHRLIVTSDAYRRRSADRRDDAAMVATDPDNLYLWRFPSRRVEAEVVRDSVLHVAGQLDPTLGGPEVEHADADQSRRRSLYISHHGEARMKFLELFDAADACEAYRRTTSIVPQQALALANSEVSRRASGALAMNLWNAVKDEGGQAADAAFITAAFEQILSRLPTGAEIELSLRFLARQQAAFVDAPATEPAADEASAETSSHDPEQRARESLVHALLNHNDFITVR